MNLLLDVGFNREVAEDGALYWTKEEGNLKNLIEKVDNLKRSRIEQLGKLAHERIELCYGWGYIAEEYRKLFEG